MQKTLDRIEPTPSSSLAAASASAGSLAPSSTLLRLARSTRLDGCILLTQLLVLFKGFLKVEQIAFVLGCLVRAGLSQQLISTKLLQSADKTTSHYLVENLGEQPIDRFFSQLVLVEWQALQRQKLQLQNSRRRGASSAYLDELLDRPFGLEGQERHTESDIPPLPFLFCELEPLA